MADIFISYSRADAEFVHELVPVLTAAGLSVWWDRNIVGGTEFHRVIENEINAAGKVVVLWSKTSVDSVWVRDEAGLARDQSKLVPLAIDDCVIPLGFRSIHTLRAAALETIADDLLMACGCAPRAKAETPRAAEPMTPDENVSADAKGATRGGGGGEPAQPGGSTVDADQVKDTFGDIFSDLFGQKPAATEPARGSDLRCSYTLSLEEAFRGKVADIAVATPRTCESCSGGGATAGTSATKCSTCDGQGKVRAKQGFFTIEKACPDCEGRGERASDRCEVCDGAGLVTLERKLMVNVPAGVENGSRIRLAGEGGSGARGGEAGDLYVALDVTPHEFFQREGDDLICRVPVPMTLAALGGPVEIPSIDGRLVRVQVPAGMQAGQSLRLKGRGMTKLRSDGRGDLYVRTEVETPQVADWHAREVLTELRDIWSGSEQRNLGLPVEKRGPDLSCEVTVSVAEAALGGDVTFSIQSGPTLRLRMPAGIQNGQQMRLRGLGEEGGDLYVRVRTELPTSLSEQAKDLLKELQDIDDDGMVNTESRSFMDRARNFFRSAN